MSASMVRGKRRALKEQRNPYWAAVPAVQADDLRLDLLLGAATRSCRNGFVNTRRALVPMTSYPLVRTRERCRWQ